MYVMDNHCHVEPIQKLTTTDEKTKVELALLAVSGMGCSNCANRVSNSLLSLYGVIDAYVDHTGGIAQVSFNPDLQKIDALINAVSGAGGDGRHKYEARLLATALTSSVLTRCACLNSSSPLI
jgi:copper chaperone CopZ